MRFRSAKSFRWCVTTAILLACVSVIGADRSKLPPQGIVPDEATAVKIAEAIWLPVFGEQVVAKFRPYQAELKNGVWTVYGTLPRNSRGGTPMLAIRKEDGRVIEVWHSQ
jgi:hypothetical protein